MTLRDLLTTADLYASHTGKARGTVSAAVLGRGSRLDEIEAGTGDLTTRRLARAFMWFSANWPEGLAWPAGVHRPDPHLAAPSLDDGENGAGVLPRHVESQPAIPRAEGAAR